jgi:hypothetical protein
LASFRYVFTYVKSVLFFHIKIPLSIKLTVCDQAIQITASTFRLSIKEPRLLYLAADDYSFTEPIRIKTMTAMQNNVFQLFRDFSMNRITMLDTDLFSALNNLRLLKIVDPGLNLHVLIFWKIVCVPIYLHHFL